MSENGTNRFSQKLWLSVIVYVAAAENVFFVSETSSAEIFTYTHSRRARQAESERSI